MRRLRGRWLGSQGHPEAGKVLVRVDPTQLDRALQRWNDAHGADDEVLAIDGKTLCNAIHEDQDGPCQTHILSAVGHRSQTTHHILDCCWDEDRCRIRTGHGPENTTRLQRFAIGVIRSKSHCVAAAVRRLNRKPRLVFDYLKMTENTLHPTKLAPSSARTH